MVIIFKIVCIFNALLGIVLLIRSYLLMKEAFLLASQDDYLFKLKYKSKFSLGTILFLIVGFTVGMFYAVLSDVEAMYLFIALVFLVGGGFIYVISATMTQMYGALLKQKQKIMDDLSQSRERIYHMEEMRIKAEHDVMTQLLNRSSFEIKIESYFVFSSLPVGIFIIIDLDNFKTVNDSLGHIKGDAVLLQVANALRSNFRPDDLIARMGGDEFAVFIPSNIPDQLLYNKINDLIRLLKMNIDGVVVSASIGICRTSEKYRDYQTLYYNADVALLTAKAQGKNKFVVYCKGLTLPYNEFKTNKLRF